MELPNIDRTVLDRPPLWPAGVEVMVAPQAKVAPVAPVNPPAPEASVSSPGVINAINPALQAQASAGAQTQSDPSQGSGSDNSARDWTLRKEEAAKVPEKEEPPKEPLSEMLTRHIASVWSASARVVEIFLQNQPNQNPTVQQQAQTPVQATNRQVDPLNAPGDVAKEVLTYSPTQIKEPGKVE
ncbi:hypothetical protein ACLBKS_11045 [Hylemonella sp. W303a]|uniref:hypothetical protein n=1 Tax=Hylemonella sp. W303a TaxID=3389873 RepID=UPI00396AFC08